SCLFPERWYGSWFQSGVRQPIVIQGNKFNTKGRCKASDGDKFLIVDEKGTCFRCVVIHEKHENVLQYKETYCSRFDTLYSLCSHITGDALLYSMFRQNAVPLPCPFSGYHTFSYNRGHGECKTPASTMESCTQDSRLLLRYQACPDVHGSESTVEELQCLATWKEGSSRYLVGKIEHGHVTSNEDRYRCFVYEKGGGGGGRGEEQQVVVYRVAQSGDATCNGLFSPMEGSRTMTLHRASPTRCKFPSWLTSSSHWHSLDYRRTYSFHHKNSTLRLSGDAETGREDVRIQCSETRISTPDMLHIVGHYTVGCQSGYVCLMFYKRDVHVIEVQSGTYTRQAEEACSISYFDRNKLPFITLVTSNPEQRKCPHFGKFSVTGVSRRGGSESTGRSREIEELSAEGCSLDLRSLIVGCGHADTMEFRSHCDSPATNIVSAYTCHASWSDNGTSYLITTPLSRSSHGAKRYCFVYTMSQVAPTPFSTSGDTCSRAITPGLTGVLAFNITSQGASIMSCIFLDS
ncbi:hypothetical protein AAG570_005209, partial [Ranatra chinensis]